jgi:ABC-type multidrug transport system fused ATPase/permease subunit
MELLNYKNNIVELGIEICKNLNIINETNTYKIISNEIIENVLEFTNEIYKNNLSHNQVSQDINDKYYTDFLLKYFFMSITTFSPSIVFKLNDLSTFYSVLYETLCLITINLAEKKIYEEILNFECKDENNENFFIKDSDILYKIENLSHSFDTNKIFQDVNIVIPKNKWICFYGNSGCGKSTLCNILLHKLNPSNGNIKYMGEYSDYEYTNLRNSVSFVNTDPDIFNNTILYNITYGLKELENEIVIEKVIKKINYYLELFDLSMYKNNLDKHIDSLSTGQKQRIKIIRLILHDKPIWILDEITSNIDNELEKVILQELKRIQIEKNKSVIHITHNMENINFSDEKMYILNYNIYNA